jgi:hypothetical protein
MNAPINTEVLLRPPGGQQSELQLATEGVLRYLWEGRFGTMLIEVKEGQVYVNGGLVEQAHDNATVAS